VSLASEFIVNIGGAATRSSKPFGSAYIMGSSVSGAAGLDGTDVSSRGGDIGWMLVLGLLMAIEKNMPWGGSLQAIGHCPVSDRHRDCLQG